MSLADLFSAHSELMKRVDQFMAERPDQYPEGKVDLNLTDDQKKQAQDLARSIKDNNPEHKEILDHIDGVAEGLGLIVAAPFLLLLLATSASCKPLFT